MLKPLEKMDTFGISCYCTAPVLVLPSSGRCQVRSRRAVFGVYFTLLVILEDDGKAVPRGA